MGESYSGIRALADFIRDVTKYQHRYVPNLGRQLLHKYIKCKHQHSGRGLLLTISTSVGNYLYAGELSEKIHFMSRETHTSIQGKLRQPIRARLSASHGFMGPHAARNRHTQSLDMCNKDKGTRGDPLEEVGGGGAQWAVSRPSWSAEPTKAPPTLPFDVSLAHWS